MIIIIEIVLFVIGLCIANLIIMLTTILVLNYVEEKREERYHKQLREKIINHFIKRV